MDIKADSQSKIKNIVTTKKVATSRFFAAKRSTKLRIGGTNFNSKN